MQIAANFYDLASVIQTQLIFIPASAGQECWVKKVQ